MSKNVILKDKNDNQLYPATTAEQVSYNGIINVKQAIDRMTGSPEVVENSSDMTDTSQVYLYVGSEAGYTSGDWYYYDGSDWVSGGAYGSFDGIPAPSSPSNGQYLVYNGSAWIAQSLPVYNGGVS